MERTKRVRAIAIDRMLHLEIRAKANLLPFRALLYALSHAKARVERQAPTGTSHHAHQLTRHIDRLDMITRGLDASIEIDPHIMTRHIKTATAAYVRFFYELDKEARKAYISATDNGRRGRVPSDRNLLVVPALMAEQKLQRGEAISHIFGWLYCMPFRVLYDSARTALQVAHMKQSMAIGSMPAHLSEGFTNSLAKLDSRMRAIGTGSIKPTDDEMLKNDFIIGAVKMSTEGDSSIADCMAERVETKRFSLARMHRLIRRNNH